MNIVLVFLQDICRNNTFVKKIENNILFSNFLKACKINIEKSKKNLALQFSMKR
jgi:hypothetical protein